MRWTHPGKKKKKTAINSERNNQVQVEGKYGKVVTQQKCVFL